MRVAIVGNGVVTSTERVAEKLQEFDKVIGVDGGLMWLDQMGIPPDEIIGDLDSVNDTLLTKYQNVPIRRFPTDKDESDMELAIIGSLEAKEIVLFGAFGGRIDHSLYNLALLRRYPDLLKMDNGMEEAFICRSAVRLTCFIGQTISLIPLSDQVTGVTTKGLKWELSNALFSSQFMSLSNVALLTDVEISFSFGELLICRGM